MPAHPPPLFALVAHPELVACPCCGLVQHEIELENAAEAVCSRCGSSLYHRHRPEWALALTLAALVAFIIANAFPIAEIETQGRRHQASLLDAVHTLWQGDMGLLAALVLVTTLIVPLVEISLLALALVAHRLPVPNPARIGAIKFILHTRPWGMIEVFVLGVLVSLVKLAHLAHVIPGVALWSYAALMILMAAVSRCLDTRHLWPQTPATAALPRHPRFQACTTCGLVCHQAIGHPAQPCPRCGARHAPGPASDLSRSWALLLAAILLYLPANLLPIMETGSLFGDQKDTIMSGVVFLWVSGSWPLAALVFFASVVVPLAKLLALAFLLLSVRGLGSWQPRTSRHARTRLYHWVEFVGRWSMLDIYVVTLLAALVQIESLATIHAGSGAIAFGAVVVLTMLAAMSFDPRLIWAPTPSPHSTDAHA